MDIIYSTESNTRVFFTDSPTHNKRCIDGSITGCGKCIGYCQFREHPGYLTKKLRKEHDCINKGCRYYIPKTHSTLTPSPFAVLATLL